MAAPDKTEGAMPGDLIGRSRAAVARARKAVAIAKEFKREDKARADDMRKLREHGERLFQHVENTLARARRLADSLTDLQRPKRRK